MPSSEVIEAIALAEQPFIIGLELKKRYDAGLLMEALERGQQLQDAVAGGDFATAKQLATKETLTTGTGGGLEVLKERCDRGARLAQLLSQL